MPVFRRCLRVYGIHPFLGPRRKLEHPAPTNSGRGSAGGPRGHGLGARPSPEHAQHRPDCASEMDPFFIGESATVSLSSDACGMAFDGENLWVSDPGGNRVWKVRAADRAIVNAYPVGGISPCGVAFDGANIWTANAGSSTVSKLLASNGSLVATYKA